MRDFYLAEVECHTGNALRNAVRGRQAAEVWGGLQCAGMDHRESRSSLSGGIVMTAGAMIIARNATARIRS